MTGSRQLLLAIESATARLSVALLRGDGSILERISEASGHHAEQVLGQIDELLVEAGSRPDDLTAIAVSIGPGSFTSLRVGLATAKGLAFASDRVVVPVPTLEALAFGCVRSGDEAPIAAVLDARRGELYAAVFEPSASGLQTLISDGLFAPAELAAQLPPSCRIVGEGAHLMEELLPAQVETDKASRWPRAACVAQLGSARLASGQAGAIDLAPRYVRRAEAEVTRTAIPVEDPVG